MVACMGMDEEDWCMMFVMEIKIKILLLLLLGWLHVQKLEVKVCLLLGGFHV